MTIEKADGMSVSSFDEATVITPSITGSSTAANPEQQNIDQPDPVSSVPWPGSTYIIRSVATGKAIAFHQGRVILAKLGGHDAIRWNCVQTKGWLEFQNPASGLFLGYNKEGFLSCMAKKQNLWENFCVRQWPDGGYVLLMTQYENVFTAAWSDLRLVKVMERTDDESAVLAVTDDWESESVMWEFIKVEHSHVRNGT